ncbi:MAG: S24 family peptidase [Pseudomonadota bacterium]
MKAISRSAEDQVLMHLKRIDERLDYALQKTIDQEDDRVAMPLYDIRAAAGDGAAVEFEQIDAWLYFRRDWLLKNSLTIGQCGLVRVTGDSMEPTLVADDVILVDFTSRDPMHSRIYLVRDGDDLQVKRILADPDSGFVLHSDNPTYEARPMTDSSIIIGRVSWSGRTFTNAPEALRVVR